MAKVDLEKMRHSCSHLMAAAVMELYPKTRFGIGPSIEDGFYYDFDIPDGLSEEDLFKIEEKMRELAEKNLKFEKAETKIDEALKIVKKLGQTYKVELIQDLKKEGVKKVIFYKLGDFVDLCEGPHVRTTKEIGPFKLLSVTGAYWRGSEENPMLTRIYGTCFASKSALEKYLIHREETKKRDHRKLGVELDLFVIDNNIGKGLPLFTPKGNIIRQEILDYERKLEEEAGFLHVWTPHIAKSKLYKLTGHWQHYREMMYAPFGIDEEEYVLKPMNCPHHYAIYSSRQRSYKELPIRITEPGTCYRYEKSGELTGLIRARALTIDDSHILMTEKQIEQESILCIQLVEKMYQAFELKDYYVRLSLNDPSDKIKYIADQKIWDKAGKKLENVLKKQKIKYVVAKGEASFYGPKIDYMVKDSLGREWQMSTLQLDLFMAKRLNLTYIDKNGEKQHPVILHRGLTGSIERTIGFLIEHYGGAFPAWLSPVQAVVIPITDKHNKYAKQIYDTLINSSIRAKLDDRSQTTSAKIRDAEIQRIPYMLVVGDKEVKAKKVNVRTRGEKVLGSMSLEKFLSRIKQDIVKKRQV